MIKKNFVIVDEQCMLDIKIPEVNSCNVIMVGDIENNGFHKTNENQWIYKENEDKFKILNVSLYDNYYLQEIDIDISTYTEEELNDQIEEHYDSLTDLKKIHPNSWKQIISGVIAENMEVDREFDLSFDNERKLYKYLKKEYNISN